MRLMRSKRGQMRVIETILASIIVIAALSFVTVYTAVPSSPGFEVSDLEKMGYSVLHDLDQHSLLPQFVYAENWGDLRSALKITLPVDVYFNLTVYDVYGNKINGADPIIYGDSRTFEISKNIASVTYTLTGYQQRELSGNYTATYDPRVLVLLISRG